LANINLSRVHVLLNPGMLIALIAWLGLSLFALLALLMAASQPAPRFSAGNSVASQSRSSSRSNQRSLHPAAAQAH